KSAHELLALLLKSATVTGYDIVRETWKGVPQSGDFETFWRTSVHDGVVAGSAARAKEVVVKRERLDSPEAVSPLIPEEGLELNFRLDPTVHDGRFANNGWLQELPKPMTKLTWDNAALMSPRTAEALGLASGQVAELHFGARSVLAPVWINPGQADR